MKAKGQLGAGKKPVIAYLNGGPTDNNSKLFKQGYAGVLDPLIKSGKAAKGPDQGVPAWDNQKARTIFEQMLVKTGNKIDAVAAANDGLANAVVTALKAKKLGRSRCPVRTRRHRVRRTSSPAGSPGRCTSRPRSRRTVRPRSRVALLKGGKPKTNGTTNNGEGNVPSFLATPIWITKKNIKRSCTRTDSSRSPRCARARTSSTASTTQLGWGSRVSGSPNLPTPGEHA